MLHFVVCAFFTMETKSFRTQMSWLNLTTDKIIRDEPSPLLLDLIVLVPLKSVGFLEKSSEDTAVLSDSPVWTRSQSISAHLVIGPTHGPAAGPYAKQKLPVLYQMAFLREFLLPGQRHVLEWECQEGKFSHLIFLQLISSQRTSTESSARLPRWYDKHPSSAFKQDAARWHTAHSKRRSFQVLL